MKTLNNWKKQIATYDKLSLKEAKALYTKIVSTEDDIQKELLMDKLIKGTMYVVINFIEYNKLDEIQSSLYDIDDIISTYMTILYKEIKNGNLLNAISFSHLFRKEKYDISGKLVGKNNKVEQVLGLSSSRCLDLFYKYASLKENKEYSEEQKQELFQRMIERLNLDISSTYLYNTLCPVFEEIYNTFNKDIFSISSDTLKGYIKLFIYNKLSCNLNDKVEVKKTPEDIVMYEKLKEYIDHFQLPEQLKYVLYSRYGIIDDKIKTQKELGEMFNMSKEQIRNIELIALRSCRHPSRSRKIMDYLY